MTTEELLRKVRRIEVRTKALSQQVFAGQYHSAFKGRGMAFSQVREYQWGDDVRNMDWNVTARMHSPYVKEFEEERELMVMLLVDISRSGLFGTVGKAKREQVAEIAATLAFSALLNHDKVGCILFSDRVEKFIPPGRGSSHFLHIVREMLEYVPQHDGTDVGEALRLLSAAVRRRCTAFVLSDLLDTDAEGYPRYEEALKVAASRHDISAIRVYDPRERSLPHVGLVHVKDAETGASAWVDTGRRATRAAYAAWFARAVGESAALLRRHGVDCVDIATHEDYVRGLMALFQAR